MVSKTKFLLSDDAIKKLFQKAGINGVKSIAPLGAGEYNAVYEVIADKPYVLKVAPGDDAPVLTYERDMIKSEVYWYSVMREKTDIHVPEVYYSDFSRELIPTGWFIMEKMAGKQRNEFQMSDEEKKLKERATAEMVSKMHRVHNDKFGYIQNELYDNWYLALRSIVENLIADCKKKGKKTKRGEKLLNYVDKYKDVFEKAECCMVNFDIWDPNIMCTRENGEIKYAWIDPERCFWGDRIVDFICLEMFSQLKDKKASLEGYNAVAELPIAANSDEIIRYAAAQALMGLIMETEKYYRYTPHHIGWWRNVGVSAFVFKQAFEVFKNGR